MNKIINRYWRDWAAIVYLFICLTSIYLSVYLSIYLSTWCAFLDVGTKQHGLRRSRQQEEALRRFSLMRRPSHFRRCPGTLDRLARCILRRQVRWQGLAQAWQGQEVERLRKVPQRSMALATRWARRDKSLHNARWHCCRPLGIASAHHANQSLARARRHASPSQGDRPRGAAHPRPTAPEVRPQPSAPAASVRA